MKAVLFGSVLVALIISIAVAVQADDNANLNNVKPANERVTKLFADMRDGKSADSLLAPFTALEWKDIPALIELGQSKRELKLFPINPVTSLFQTTCPEGIVALWLVEGIRQGGKFPSLHPLCLPVDIKASSNWMEQSAKNQDRLLKLYEDWWKVAGSMTPQAAAKLDPLKDSKLVWH